MVQCSKSAILADVCDWGETIRKREDKRGEEKRRGSFVLGVSECDRMKG